MEEKNVVKFKKDEFAVREYIKSNLGKGRVSKVRIEYTPVGERIIISTDKPGLIIGKRGENLTELTRVLKGTFKLENPQIDIDEIKKPEFDAQVVADDIAISLEKFGPLKFKVIAYRALQRIMKSGALGVEIRLSGKLPSSRAKTWRFAQGYLKKTGESSKIVDRAMAVAQTKPGTVGIKVGILSPENYKKLKDKIDLSNELFEKLKERSSIKVEEKKKIVRKKK